MPNCYIHYSADRICWEIGTEFTTVARRLLEGLSLVGLGSCRWADWSSDLVGGPIGAQILSVGRLDVVVENKAWTTIERQFIHLSYRKKEGRKEMFLFNDALKTFYFRLHGVRPLRERQRKPDAVIWANRSD